MLNYQRIVIDAFVEELRRGYKRTYSDLKPEYVNIIAWCARLVMEIIANSDALYHNLEHTLTVTLAGQAILEGKHLREGKVSAGDWLHFVIALLCHDIGYVRGVCKQDQEGEYATGIGEERVKIDPRETDVALTPYHVDRSKLFVKERFGAEMLEEMARVIDPERIASFIELTRFPPPEGEEYQQTNTYAGLVRAADFIGQLGDPNYMRKSPALFFEFAQIGANEKFGYEKPGDLREDYPSFFWGVVNPYIEDAISYLQLTQEGKQWIASLYGQVFAAEHRR